KAAIRICTSSAPRVYLLEIGKCDNAVSDFQDRMHFAFFRCHYKVYIPYFETNTWCGPVRTLETRKIDFGECYNRMICALYTKYKQTFYFFSKFSFSLKLNSNFSNSQIFKNGTKNSQNETTLPKLLRPTTVIILLT